MSLSIPRLHLKRYFSSSFSKTKHTAEKPVLKVIGQHHRRAKRVYVWGNAGTGALGVKKLLVPEKEYKRPKLIQSRPYNFHWPIRITFNVKHTAAGCGYTLLAGSWNDNSLTVFGFGLNTDSQLGFHSEKGKPLEYLLAPEEIKLPVDSRHSKATFTDIACGRAHTVVATDKAVFTFGNNALGQCGREIVNGEVYKGNRTIHVIDRSDVVKVVCGFDHTLLLTNSGKVFSCGLGTDGQTGLGDFKCRGELTEVKGDIEGVVIKDIASRCDTVLAVSEEGELFGWGNSEYGQLNMITKDPQINVPRHLPVTTTCGLVKGVAASGTSCAILNDKGEVYVWGYGILGKGPNVQQSDALQLLPMPLFGKTPFCEDVQVDSIFSGVSSFAAITNKKSLYTWGKNMHGCLGLGRRQDQFFPFRVSMGCEVNHVACGADHMVAMCRAYI